MASSTNFAFYQTTLKRVLFTEMLDEHIQKQQKRRLSIVGPCFTHEQWLLMQAERRRAVDHSGDKHAPAGIASARD